MSSPTKVLDKTACDKYLNSFSSRLKGSNVCLQPPQKPLSKIKIYNYERYLWFFFFFFLIYVILDYETYFWIYLLFKGYEYYPLEKLSLKITEMMFNFFFQQCHVCKEKLLNLQIWRCRNYFVKSLLNS